MSSKRSKNKNKSVSTSASLVPITTAAGTAATIVNKVGVGVFVAAKNEQQKQAIELIEKNLVTFLFGHPGTGKSFVSMAIGLRDLIRGKYKKLILTRPYVEAGEHLGFLPGGFNNKIAPFMYPLMEICTTLIGDSRAVIELIDSGAISVMPMAYLRGCTFSDTFVVADEFQNATIAQTRLLLTRIGNNSKIVITGDTEQSDLHPKAGINGLSDAIKRLNDIPGIQFYEFGPESCVRSGIVSDIEDRYRNTRPI